jgi:hypothetical protein
MSQATDFRDGLCRPCLSIRAHQLLSTVCIRGGLACPLMPHEEAQAFLARIGRNPTVAIRLLSDADEVPHHTVRWADAATAPQPGAPVPAEVFNRKRDLDVLQRLGLLPGDTRRARYLYELLFERIKTPASLCAYDTPSWEGCPHAKSGVYERVREQGWRGIVHARTREEMDESRRQGAKRVAERDRLFIRPHHLMCVACWYAGGEGKGLRPNDTIGEIHERLRREPSVPITLVEGTCDVCDCCDGFDPETTRCVHPGGLIRDYKKDLDVFQKLGLAPGATLPADELVRLVFERIASTREICGYGDGIVRAEEWRICGGAEGSPGYVRSREKGML